MARRVKSSQKWQNFVKSNHTDIEWIYLPRPRQKGDNFPPSNSAKRHGIQTADPCLQSPSFCGQCYKTFIGRRWKITKK